MFVSQETKVQSSIENQELDQTSTAFWLPYMQPIAEASELKVSKNSPQCPGEHQHNLSLKKLTPVIFSKQENGGCICPVCVKSFKNGVSITILKPCGHAICKGCTKDLITEGTGFAAGGKALVEKQTVAFM
jgi:nitric oxide synthase-interacting protein